MPKHRTYSTDFKRQIAPEFLGGETLHGLAKRHGISRNLIRIWVEKYEVGAFDEDIAAADMLQHYVARVAALIGKLLLENDVPKGTSKNAHQPKNASMPVIAGPVVSPSRKDVERWSCRIQRITIQPRINRSKRRG